MKGLSITSLAQIERLAAVRLPDTGMMKDERDTHNPDGRIAMAWKIGDREISLNEDCLISFQDKFFTIDEMAVILHAVNKTRPRYPFTILGYDGKRYEFADREVSLLIAKLPTSSAASFLFQCLRRRETTGSSSPPSCCQGHLMTFPKALQGWEKDSCSP